MQTHLEQKCPKSSEDIHGIGSSLGISYNAQDQSSDANHIVIADYREILYADDPTANGVFSMLSRSLWEPRKTFGPEKPKQEGIAGGCLSGASRQ